MKECRMISVVMISVMISVGTYSMIEVQMHVNGNCCIILRIVMRCECVVMFGCNVYCSQLRVHLNTVNRKTMHRDEYCYK